MRKSLLLGLEEGSLSPAHDGSIFVCSGQQSAARARRDRGRKEGRTGMDNLTRRSVLRSSVGFAAAGALARPYVANAAATTAEVWWIQGFVPEEDASFKKIVAEYEKASGNKIDYSIMPFAPLRQKIVSAVASGVVPDLYQSTPTELIALHAWDGKLVDVTDVIETQKIGRASCRERV